MSIPTEHLDGLETLSRDGAAAAHLDTAAGIRGVAARRTRRRVATGAAALTVLAVVSAPALVSWTGGDSTAPLPPAGSPTAPPPPTDGTDAPTEAPTPERAVHIRTSDGRWVAPAAEGLGVTTFRTRAAAPYGASWYLREAPGDRVRIVSTSKVDDRELCLTDAGLVEHVTGQLCNARSRLFELTEVGAPGEVTIRSDRGLIGVETGSPFQNLLPGLDPGDPTTVFTVG